MPIYEYQCKACSHQFETIQSFSEDPLTDCPKCHKSELNKLISAPAFQLKGTGWYVTDFKDSGKQPKKPASNDDSGKEAPKTETEDKKKSEDKNSAS